MRLLILGGTAFVGRHIVGQALDRGWQVTLFNRGKTNPGLFPEVDQRIGDRLASDLASLASGEWDACIDTSAYVPRVVREAVSVLKGRVGHYQLVSTISVYSDLSAATLTEDSAVGTLEDEATEVIDGGSYGPLKVLCEREAAHGWGERLAVTRPGLIVGPWDKTDRFTYWPVRMNQGGEVLVPDTFDQPSQFIDVRDLASFMLDISANEVSGTYNATGPAQPWKLGEVLETVRRQTQAKATLCTAPVDFLLGNGVEPWSGLPLWLPEDSWGMSRVDVSRAIGRGLALRPLEDTIADTLAWWRSLDPPRNLQAGITTERERELIDLLRTQGQG